MGVQLMGVHIMGVRLIGTYVCIFNGRNLSMVEIDFSCKLTAEVDCPEASRPYLLHRKRRSTQSFKISKPKTEIFLLPPPPPAFTASEYTGNGVSPGEEFDSFLGPCSATQTSTSA
jgi:hypothetical protein